MINDPLTLIHGDALGSLTTLTHESAQTCVTSPPYWGLRDYGIEPLVWDNHNGCEHEWGVSRTKVVAVSDKREQAHTSERDMLMDGQVVSQGSFCQCGAWRGCLGLEPTPELFVQHLVGIFREVKRVLRKDGTVWLNLGDSYAGSNGNGNQPQTRVNITADKFTPFVNVTGRVKGLKPKDLVGIPWMVAFALRADGWYLRSDVIWCLSGGTWVYARTQKGDMPIMVRDLARLREGTVQLWNGDKWTNLLGMSKSKRQGDEITITLRSGERISCTPTHRFPANKVRDSFQESGVFEASELRVGDSLVQCRLPGPCVPKHPKHIDLDAAWLAGLYIAEGSMSEDTIQLAGHVKEEARWLRVCSIATSYGGSATRTIDGNKMDIRIYGKMLVALIAELVSGRTAKDKCFAPVVWRYTNEFLAEMLNGYLSGDAHDDEPNQRFRLGFRRNYNLERDLRTACARLGYTLTLNPSVATLNGREFPIFRGELRKSRSGHHNEKDRCEIVRIERSRCREVYDLGVDDEPHVFALASGVLTHNSKPNPMPESVTDRPTKSHEYIFLLSKSQRYYYDAEAIRDPPAREWWTETRTVPGNPDRNDGGSVTSRPRRADKEHGHVRRHAGFNDRWDAMSKEEQAMNGRNKRSVWEIATNPFPEAHFATFPPDLIKPCILAGAPVGSLVLDPFAGSGTTGKVAIELGRKALLIEPKAEYIEMIKKRCQTTIGLPL